MREAHALRVALGRGADTTPDWPTLTAEGRDHAFVQVDAGVSPGSVESQQEQTALYHHANTLQRSRHRGQRFNERGRPVNPLARRADSEQCIAQNIAQQIAAANMPRDITRDQAHAFANCLKAENVLRNKLGDYFLWVEFAARHWIDAASHRWMTFGTYGDYGFVQAILRGYQRRGFWDFAFAGFIPYAVSAEAHERMDFRLAQLDDFFKQISWPSLPEYISGAAVIALIRITTEVFFFGPLTLWTHLQTLDLLPGVPALPPLSFFNPLSALSPFQPLGFAWAHLYSPLLVQIAADNLDKFLSIHFLDYCQSIEEKVDVLVLDLETEVLESNIPDEMDLESLDSPPSVAGPLALLTARERSGARRSPHVWRIIQPGTPKPQPFSLLAAWRRKSIKILTSILRHIPRRPSSWTRLDPEVTFDTLRSTNDWSTSPYGTDMGPSSLHYSPTDCADYIWRQVVMYPFHIFANAVVLRCIARDFLQGLLSPGLLEKSGPRALRAAGDVYPLVPSFALHSRGLGGGVMGVGLGVWRGMRPYLAEWAIRACIGVAVCGLHTAAVGVLVRWRSAKTREALNWRDDGRRDWT